MIDKSFVRRQDSTEMLKQEAVASPVVLKLIAENCARQCWSTVLHDSVFTIWHAAQGVEMLNDKIIRFCNQEYFCLFVFV